ncbi:IS5 family transposase [Candidatus Regiella endosymbiont of Tuberolachnus salignus]|uniref:IS5 family transposase n=1 Tax=Candidatus Regiella endosymbiont of Tuberolachnus salignus TaxID=3077956 RepID=UPI0030CA807E
MKTKSTRRGDFLAQMNRIVPWEKILSKLSINYPKPTAKGGRPAKPLEVMLRIYFLQNGFNYADLSMEEALYDIPLLRQFTGISVDAIPSDPTILHFRHWLEKHHLSESLFEEVNAHLASCGLFIKRGSIVDATIIHAPSSTKNRQNGRDPEMKATRKGNQCFGMKAHIGVDAQTGLVHSLVGTSANVAEVTQVHHLLHGQEEVVHGDAGYKGVMRRSEHQHRAVIWHIPRRRVLALPGQEQQVWEKHRHRQSLIAKIRAKVEHPFRVLKCQFNFRKVRYKGLAKNTAQLFSLFALTNLFLARKILLCNP